MFSHNAFLFSGRRIRIVYGLLLGMLTTSQLGCGQPAKTNPADAPPLETFHRLSPTERLQLIAKAGIGNPATQKVTQGVLEEIIVERGSLEAVDNSFLSCPVVPGTRTKSRPAAAVIKWLIDEGSVVKKGDKLIELDDSELQEDLKESKHKLDNAQADLAKAKEKLNLAKQENVIEVRLAEIKLRLAELKLKQNKDADRDSKEELQLKVEQAKLGLKRLKLRIPEKEAAAGAEVQAKEILAEDAKNRQLAVQAELPKCILRAPQNGMVFYHVSERYNVVVAAGEPVREGQKLLQIADLSQMELIVNVPEALATHLKNVDPKDKSGWQTAQIAVDAFPRQIFNGHVKSHATVANQVDTIGDWVKAYRTIVSIDSPVEGLRPGMSAEVRIATRQVTKEPVLQAPVQSVVTIGGKQLCFVVTKKQIQEREVVTGLSNDRFVEITMGLKEGDIVLSSPRELSRQLAPLLVQGKTPAGKN